MNRNRFSVLAAKGAMVAGLAAVLALGAGVAAAQSFSSKPIRLVVAYPPGGATDILARADRKSTRLNSSH